MAIFTRRSLRGGPKVVPTEPVELDPAWKFRGNLLNYFLLRGDAVADLVGQSNVLHQNIGASSTARGPAAYFNGTNARVEVSNPVNPTSATVFAFFKTTQSSSNETDYLRLDGNFTALQLFSSKAHSTVFHGNSSTYTYTSFTWDGVWNDDKVHFIVSSYDETSGYNFTLIDGTVVASQSIGVNTPLPVSSKGFYIGGNEVNSGWVPGNLFGVGRLDVGLSLTDAVALTAKPFGMLRPDVRRQYYVASAPAGDNTIISGGIGRIGGGVVASLAQSAALASEAVIGAAIEATQSQTVTSDAALNRAVANWTATQRNATALAGTAASVETAATATQSQSAAIGATVPAPVSAWSGAQSQAASVAGAVSSLSAAWTVTQANVTSLAISATLSPISGATTATQAQGAALTGAISPLASAWTLAQANLTTLAIDATLGAVQSAATATQAQGAAIAAEAQGVAADATAAISQSASLEGRALPLIASWTVANANAVTLVVNAVLGRVTAAASLSQSQQAEIEAALAPLVAAWSSVGIEVSPHRIAVWPAERRIATWPVENRIARIAA